VPPGMVPVYAGGSAKGGCQIKQRAAESSDLTERSDLNTQHAALSWQPPFADPPAIPEHHRGTGALVWLWPVTFGGVGSSVHHLEVSGTLTLAGDGGWLAR